MKSSVRPRSWLPLKSAFAGFRFPVEVIVEFGPAPKTSRAQSAGYPFTQLRSDGIWTLNRDVPMDTSGPLAANQVVGRLDPTLESVLAKDPALIQSAPEPWQKATSRPRSPPTCSPSSG